MAPPQVCPLSSLFLISVTPSPTLSSFKVCSLARRLTRHLVQSPRVESFTSIHSNCLLPLMTCQVAFLTHRPIYLPPRNYEQKQRNRHGLGRTSRKPPALETLTRRPRGQDQRPRPIFESPKTSHPSTLIPSFLESLRPLYPEPESRNSLTLDPRLSNVVLADGARHRREWRPKESASASEKRFTQRVQYSCN